MDGACLIHGIAAKDQINLWTLCLWWQKIVNY